ncbi:MULTISPECIES: SulP family inorganic anion transporter [unclassified Rhizobium]|uniref:SulP family inorganic anion transporter n=1 Tax=unclassified Rhizobium TaxID=2613769 RepID=UPI00161815BC|nr:MULTISPECIES: SulP family inorganic anion transporter [unclassified Rhizobium]MBB3545242.1 high affinity sulfate transporter 1 [Rhizobium sp. BK399]
MEQPNVRSAIRAALPIVDWVGNYRPEWLVQDAFAGVALWAVMVPEGMAYSGIVGVPPIMGLTTIVPALLAYALFGSSRQLVVGPDTATGLISALTVGAIASQGTAQFNSLTSSLAVLIGALFLISGFLRMGWVASFIPTPVMRGFIEGLVYVTIIGQVPQLLGINGSAGNFFKRLGNILVHLDDMSLAPALTGLISLLAMMLLRRLNPRVPAPLLVMALATIAIGVLGGEATGVHVAGHIPSGLPNVVLPNLDPAIWVQLAPGALAIVMVGYAEALGAAKAAALENGGNIDPNQELVAHGPANILSGLLGGFLVVGSLSKTSVAMAAGARTQAANLVAALLCFLTLFFLTPLFRTVPQPALAAVVIAAMLHLSTPRYLRDLFRRSPWSFVNGIIVVAGELVLGVPQGIVLGVVISILTLIYHASHPLSSEVGQLPGTEAYRDIHLHPEAKTFAGLLIWRVGGDLFFASIGRMITLLKASLTARPGLRCVLLDLGSVNFIDVSATDELFALIKELQGIGVTVAFSRVRDPVRDSMRLGGIEKLVGPSGFHERTTDGVRSWLHESNEPSYS